MRPTPNQILHVPRRFVSSEWGGTETVILECARQQRLMGYEPSFFTSMALANQREERIDGFHVKRFPHHYPYLGLSSENLRALDKKGGNLLSWPLFRALLREPNVRVFHAHALKRLGGMVRSAARLRQRPYVVSLHGGVFDVPGEETEAMTRPTEGKLEWGKPFGALLGSRRVLQEADHVICVDPSEVDKARRALGHDRVSHLPNGVDTERFATGDGAAFRSTHEIAQDAFVVLCLSRIDAQKNQLGLLRSFKALHEKESKAHLVIAGPETQPNYANLLRREISQSGLGHAVSLLSGIANDSPDLANAFHAADVFALASRHEPFGIVVLEAWCAGCPVVTSRTGGLGRLVTHGVNGLTFDPLSPEAEQTLANHLSTLSNDPELRARLGAEGNAEAATRYAWPRVAAQLETIYQQAEARVCGRHSRCA